MILSSVGLSQTLLLGILVVMNTSLRDTPDDASTVAMSVCSLYVCGTASDGDGVRVGDHVCERTEGEDVQRNHHHPPQAMATCM